MTSLRLALSSSSVSPWECAPGRAGDMADEEPSVGATLDHSGEAQHGNDLGLVLGSDCRSAEIPGRLGAGDICEAVTALAVALRATQRRNPGRLPKH